MKVKRARVVVSTTEQQDVAFQRLAKLTILVLTGFLLFGVKDSQASVTSDTEEQSQSLLMSGISQVGYDQRNLNKEFKHAVHVFKNEDYIAAFRMFKALSELNHTASQYYLGMHYDLGLGVFQNQERANFWYSQAADKGDDRAQHNLAVAYAKGQGVKTDIGKALSLWLQSASQGNTDSAYNLGILYAVGADSIKPNPAKAMKWWRKAANNGDGYAQYNLGTMYANGDVGNKNYCEAIKWWKLSVSNGVEEAGIAIEVLKDRSDYHVCKE